MRLVSILATAFVMTACGAMNNEGQVSKKIVSVEEARSHSASLPTTTIVRVPVGSDGKELNDKAELRVTSNEVAKDSVASAFASAKAPETTVDELDKTTSTESYHGWRRWCCAPRCGTGYYGNNYYGNNYYGNNWNWSFYRPTYYYYGYYYNWNYANTYNYGGYNYYQYNSSFNSGYSGYGAAQSYGYNY